MLVFVQIFFRRMYMRLCYVHLCYQPTPQLQNYSSLWIITYQEIGDTWIGHSIQTELLPWLKLSGYTTQVTKRLLLNVSLRTVLSLEKCWLDEECHLNVTFCTMWLKLSTTLKHLPFAHVCLPSFVRKQMQSTHISSHTQKWDSFLKVGPWPEFLS